MRHLPLVAAAFFLPLTGSESSTFNRYKASYSSYFTSFNEFLSFGWSAIVVTDKRTGKGHVTVKGGSGSTSTGGTTNGYSSGGAVGQFARMIKTRSVAPG